jgi:hypothetical protein
MNREMSAKEALTFVLFVIVVGSLIIGSMAMANLVI